MNITVTFRESEARSLSYYLRLRYNKRKDTNLSTLVKQAAREVAGDQAAKELAKRENGG